MYTREMEEQFQAADEAVRRAEDARRPLKNARESHVDQLGILLTQCPQQSGSRGAALWAIERTNKLTELLAPFATPQ